MLYEKIYTNIVNDVINNNILTESEEQVLKECLNLLKNNDVSTVFEDMYKLYLNNYSMIELGKIYNRSARTIQLIFKKVGLNRNRYEAQQIASKKRDYVEIRKTYKNTMVKRLADNQLFGSKIEQFTRYEVNILLNELIPECEILVGINTMTKVGELDIPIVLFYNTKVYKYEIEVDGIFFHDDKNKEEIDFNKCNKLNEIGYKIFRLKTKAYFSTEDIPTIKYEREIKSKLLNICTAIKDEILNK